MRRRGKDCAPALEEAEARGLQGKALQGKATAPTGADQLVRDPHRPIVTVGPDRCTPELQDALFGDRDWFAAHPGRRYRVRPVVLGEHGEGANGQPSPTHSIVEQVRPGVRRRVPVSLNAAAVRDFAEIEERTDRDAIIGTFAALLVRDRIARVGDAVALARCGGTA